MRTNLNGKLRFFEITIGIASYTETPRLEVIYSEEAKHITKTATTKNTIRKGSAGNGEK